MSTWAPRRGQTITTKPDGTRHLDIADSVKTIGDWAFVNNQLTSVGIPNSVSSIGNGAFAGNLLTKVTLPKALYNRRGTAFDRNRDILEFYEYEANAPGNRGARLN